MERDGLIRRVRDPNDGRQSRVHLTERARDLEAELVKAVRRVNRRATRGLDADARRALLATLRDVAANLDEDE